MGPLIPLFWTSGYVSSGFQSQSGLPYLCLVEVCVTHYLRFTSGARSANLLMACMAAELISSITCEQALVGLGNRMYCGIDKSSTN